MHLPGVTDRRVCPRAQPGKGISARRDVVHRVCHVGCVHTSFFPEAVTGSHLDDDVLDDFLLEKGHRPSENALLESLSVNFQYDDARGRRRRQEAAQRQHRHIHVAIIESVRLYRRDRKPPGLERTGAFGAGWHDIVLVRQPSGHDDAAISETVDEKRGVDDLVVAGLHVEERRNASVRNGVETIESRVATNVEEQSIRWATVPSSTSRAENPVHGGSDELFSFRGTDPTVNHARVCDQKIALTAPGLLKAPGFQQSGVVGERRRELTRAELVESQVTASDAAAAH